MLPTVSLLALGLASASPAAAQRANQFVEAGNTLVSAMMMFVGNEERVYILDKAEGNAAQINGHPAWGSVWDMNTHEAEVMDVRTNVFCASGMHMPNGSWVTFGGNGAVGRGGAIGDQVGPTGTGAWDSVYQDFDGGTAIRVLNPCSTSDNFADPSCQWFDDPEVLAMQRRRWYSTAEPTGEGVVVLIGGFVNGGYINRNTPNTDPEFSGGAAESTYEFFPSNGIEARRMQFMVDTSGLNAYAHAFQMPSGRMFVQANVSSILWDYNTNEEERLPDMPGGVIRVYPASGAVAMLPLTPENNYTPTILFCGGSDMPEPAWGNYSFPAINTWLYPASKDCQRITPEPEDGSAPVYEQDDDMLEGRTMGQFIILPDGTLFVVNGGLNGTAGYAEATGETFSYADMPFGQSLASGPVLTPAIYDPKAPRGSRWSNAGLGSSNIPRLYHSSAVLLPDASVLIAGSNPNVDVNLTTIYPTEYTAEVFYPSYFSAATRPVPQGVPRTLSYGGDPFDITIPASSYSGSANDAAKSAQVVINRSGFTTHAMNMGQRHMQLNNTFTVNEDGSIVLHVAQAHPNPNIFQPGPAFLFVVVNGIPSNGTHVIVGNGIVGPQPTAAASVLPPSVERDSVSGTGQGGNNANNDDSQNSASGGSTMARIVGPVAGILAVLGVLGALFGLYIYRRRRQESQSQSQKMGSRSLGDVSSSADYAMTDTSSSRDMGPGMGATGMAGATAAGFSPRAVNRDSDSSAFLPLQQQDYSSPYSAQRPQDSAVWNSSTASLTNPVYNDVHNNTNYNYNNQGGGGGGVFRGAEAGGGRMQSIDLDSELYSSRPMDPNPSPSGMGVGVGPSAGATGGGYGSGYGYHDDPPPQNHGPSSSSTQAPPPHTFTHHRDDGLGYWNSDYYRQQSQSNGHNF